MSRGSRTNTFSDDLNKEDLNRSDSFQMNSKTGTNNFELKPSPRLNNFRNMFDVIDSNAQLDRRKCLQGSYLDDREHSNGVRSIAVNTEESFPVFPLDSFSKNDTVSEESQIPIIASQEILNVCDCDIVNNKSYSNAQKYRNIFKTSVDQDLENFKKMVSKFDIGNNCGKDNELNGFRPLDLKTTRKKSVGNKNVKFTLDGDDDSNEGDSNDSSLLMTPAVPRVVYISKEAPEMYSSGNLLKWNIFINILGKI